MASSVSRASVVDRVVWVVLFALALATLAAARVVTPDESGLGTHEQLGLPPCGLYALFSLPCPACGLTTAFAHLAHWNVVASLRAHPLGLPLFLVTCATLPLSVWAWLKRASVSAVIDALEADRWALWLVFSLLGAWCARLLGSVLS